MLEGDKAIVDRDNSNYATVCGWRLFEKDRKQFLHGIETIDLKLGKNKSLWTEIVMDCHLLSLLR